MLALALPAAAAAQSTGEADASLLDSLLSRILGPSGPATPAPAAAASAPADAAPPSLGASRWLGFTPVIAGDPAPSDVATLTGPFPEAGTDAWVTDTVSGLTTRVRLVWREASPDGLAELSAPAAEALGLPPGAVANVAIYVAR